MVDRYRCTACGSFSGRYKKCFGCENKYRRHCISCTRFVRRGHKKCDRCERGDLINEWDQGIQTLKTEIAKALGHTHVSIRAIFAARVEKSRKRKLLLSENAYARGRFSERKLILLQLYQRAEHFQNRLNRELVLPYRFYWDAGFLNQYWDIIHAPEFALYVK